MEGSLVPVGRFGSRIFNPKPSPSAPQKEAQLEGSWWSRGVGEDILCPGEKRAEKTHPLSLGLCFLGLAQHSRLNLSKEESHDPQIPENLELGDMVFSERKEIELWATRGTLVSWGSGYCWPEAWIILSLGVGWLIACGPIE